MRRDSNQCACLYVWQEMSGNAVDAAALEIAKVFGLPTDRTKSISLSFSAGGKVGLTAEFYPTGAQLFEVAKIITSYTLTNTGSPWDSLDAVAEVNLGQGKDLAEFHKMKADLKASGERWIDARDALSGLIWDLSEDI
jgi:hypothetical protein